MSEEQTKPKRRGGDPAFMAKMREKAAEKRRQIGLVNKAEKVKKAEEFKQKVAEADKIINNKTTPKNEKVVDEVDIEDTTLEKEHSIENQPKKQSVKEPIEKPMSFKELYYKHKLEKLQNEPKEEPKTPRASRPIPHEVALHTMKQDINKQVMSNLFKQYFPTENIPF